MLTKIAPFDAYRSSQSSTGEIHSRDAEGCGGMVHVDNPAVPRTRGAENLLTFLGFFSWYCMCALSAYSNQLFVYDKVFSMVLTCSTHFYMMFQHQLKGFAPTTWNSE